MLVLRDYQQKGIDTIRRALTLNDSVIYVLPTGGGKTALASVMAGNACAKGKRCLFLVHRRELMRQTQDAFTLSGIHYGTIQAGKPTDPLPRVHIGSIQTVVRRLERLQRPDLLIVDECHHARAASWAKVIEWAGTRPDGCKTVGLTATPCRLDGKGLRGHFDEIVMGPKPAELIRDGWLADYRVYAPCTVDTSGLHIRAGDYKREELEALMDKGTIIGDAVEHYKRITPGEQALMFNVSIKHAMRSSEAFNRAGISSACVYGSMPSLERDQIFCGFKKKDFLVLMSVDIIGEGVDIPSVSCLMFQRATKSLSLYLQHSGRGFRPEDDKILTILDFVGNVRRHGFPDQDREWSLDGAQKPRKEMDKKHVLVKQCPECYRVVFQSEKECQYCGHEFGQEREIREADGELVELDRKEQQGWRRRQDGQAQTYKELVELGKARKYRDPYGWAWHKDNARKAKRGVRV